MSRTIVWLTAHKIERTGSPMSRTVAVQRLHLRLALNGTGNLFDSASAFARPFRRLFQDGVDPGKVCYVVVRQSAAGPAHLLGTVCETPGDRLLFFPGCRSRHLDRHFTVKPRIGQRLMDRTVDHFTFDIRTAKGHVTEVTPHDQRKVVGGFPRPRQEVAPRLYAWFGLTLRSPSFLDRVPRWLRFTVACPRPDATRRLAAFQQVCAAAAYVELPIPKAGSGEFLQINFYVDLDPDRPLTRVTTFIPTGPPELKHPITLPERPKANLQGFSVRNGSALVQVDASVWRGETVRQVGFGL